MPYPFAGGVMVKVRVKVRVRVGVRIGVGVTVRVRVRVRVALMPPLMSLWQGGRWRVLPTHPRSSEWGHPTGPTRLDS